MAASAAEGKASEPLNSKPGLIPHQVLLGNPERQQARVSPNGRWISWLAPTGDGKDVMNVWMAPRGSDGVEWDKKERLTDDQKRGIRAHYWAKDSRSVLYMQDTNGDEVWHLWSVDVNAPSKSRAARDLTPFQGVRASNLMLSRAKPSEALIGLNLRSRQRADVYRLDLKTGALELDTLNPGDVVAWHASKDDFRVVAATAMDNASGDTILRWRPAEMAAPIGSVGWDIPEPEETEEEAAAAGSNRLRLPVGPTAGWKDFGRLPFGEEGGIVAVRADGKGVIAESTVGSDLQRVVSVDFEGDGAGAAVHAEGGASSGSGSAAGGLVSIPDGVGQLGKPTAVLFEAEKCDVGQVVLNEETREVEAVSAEYLRPEWSILSGDTHLAGIWQAVLNTAKGDAHVVSRSTDQRVWILADAPPSGATQYYIIHAPAKAASEAPGGGADDFDTAKARVAESCMVEKLFVDRPDLAEWTLPSPKPLVLRARDGFLLPSYLTPAHGSGLEEALNKAISEESEGDADAVAALKLDSDSEGGAAQPMVLLPHGGPWARDSFGYSPYCQWLASRGFHVLQVNFRGSTGFGKKFLHAGNREWGQGKMQHDLTDAVSWAVGAGVTTAGKVGIFGGSYGGYAVLAGLAFTPDLYACGVDIVGPSHAKTLLESIPPWWAPMKKQLALRVGDVENDEEFNKKISPVFHAGSMKSPLLIVQGQHDPRVKKAESDQIAEALRGHGIETRYVLYEDEGHGFARPENKVDFLARAEAFLTAHLGGKGITEAERKEIEGASAKEI